MKKLEDMTGTEKAAALIVAMGHDAAAEIMRFLDEDAVYKISAEIARIDRLSSRDREDLIGEFFVQLRKMKKSAQGGEQTAKKLLSDAFGEEKAREVFSRVKQMNIDESFSFFDDTDPQVIADLTMKEHPQILAVLISHLNPAKAGQVLKLYDRNLSKEIALRIARMGKISPEAVVQISSSLQKKYEEHKSKAASVNTPGGVNTLASIMNHLGGDAEKRLMSHFDEEMPEFAGEIRKKISSIEFEAIAGLTNKEIRLILEKIPENRTIAKALKGTDDDIRYKILRNMSTHRAEDVVGLMDLLGPVRMSEVTEARQQIVSVMRTLNEKGSILIRRTGEDVVE